MPPSYNRTSRPEGGPFLHTVDGSAQFSPKPRGRNGTTRQWLRAIAIAKILFEEEGYHTRYLEEIEIHIKAEGLGQHSLAVSESRVHSGDRPESGIGSPTSREL
jgi:hypothetical protein